MCKKLICLVCLTAMLCTAGSASAQILDENFDSLAVGTNMQSVAGWEGWYGDQSVAGHVTDEQAYSGNNSLRFTRPVDASPFWTSPTSGKWVLSTMQYVPSAASSGDAYYGVLHSYQEGTAGSAGWIAEVISDFAAGDVRLTYGDTVRVPLVRDAWAEIRTELNFDTNVANFYYNDELLGTRSAPSLEGFDLWANSDDVMYFDDFWLGTREAYYVQPAAYGPSPVDGALLETTWANLKWTPGMFAVSHDVYIGDHFEDVNSGAAHTFIGNQQAPNLVVGLQGFPLPDGLVPGTTYYWRIDEVNDADPNSPWKGDVWSFWMQPKKAYEPSPVDGASFVMPETTLAWTPGFGGTLQYVYFGDNPDDVANATGALPQTEATHDPGALDTEKTYYWRVDQFDGLATHKGDVWSFTTLPDIPVAGDLNLVLWWTLDEGQGAAGPADWSGHGGHAAVADDPQWIVDGYQRGALQFDGSGDYLYKQLAPAMPSQTVCVWARIDKAPASILGWSNAHPTSGTHDREFYVNADGTVAWRIWTSANNIVTSLGTIADGRWHHLAGVYTDEGSTELYLDGVFQGSNAASGIYNAYSNPFLTVGIDSQQNRHLTGAVDDVRVYDKALTADEIGGVMLGDTKLAGNPVPDRNAVVDIRDIGSLSFSAGDGAASHDVYFGQDRDPVAGADNSSPEFQGNQAATNLSLADLVEFGGGDYYWRIDEVEAGEAVVAGTVWKFTVPDYLIVDDFESYNDIEEGQEGSNRIYLTWLDGYGTTTNGSQAGNLDVPLMSQGRSGARAMPLSYDNAGKTSEATRTLVAKKDWTVHGVTKLVVWFRGDSANAAERMFVALGNATVYHPDDAATQDTGWNEWIIDLTEFAGVDLANVPSITLGFGTRGAPVATGGTGTVDFDDIGLIR